MKKYSFLFVCLGLMFCVSGCGNPGKLIPPSSLSRKLISLRIPPQTHGYMDEMTGILMDFDGTLLTLQGFQRRSLHFQRIAGHLRM